MLPNRRLAALAVPAILAWTYRGTTALVCPMQGFPLKGETLIWCLCLWSSSEQKQQTGILWFCKQEKEDGENCC